MFCSRTFESRTEELRRLCGEKCYLEALRQAHHDLIDEERLPIPPMTDKPVIPIPLIYDDDYRQLMRTIRIRTEWEAKWVKRSVLRELQIISLLQREERPGQIQAKLHWKVRGVHREECQGFC